MRLCLLPLGLLAACAAERHECAAVHRWASPSTLQTIANPVSDPGAGGIILLGEHHDSAADHAWQRATIQRLYAADRSVVLGFEMFPRAAQPVLDEWIAGRLSEADFLVRTDWRHVWGFPAELYMPIFRYARDRRIPMLALNVSRELVHRVGQIGWANVPVSEREGVGTPALASVAYARELAEIMSGHGGPPMSPERLGHFVDAQLLWDRAMAEAIGAQRTREPGRTVVALIGAGHLENREGVPHQLDALGQARPHVLIPVDSMCKPPGRGYADAIYVVGPALTGPPDAPRS